MYHQEDDCVVLFPAFKKQRTTHNKRAIFGHENKKKESYCKMFSLMLVKKN